MPLAVTDDLSADVLEGHEPRAGRMWRNRSSALLQRRVPLLLVVGGLAVALVGGVAFSAAQDGTSPAAQDGTEEAVIDASGRMFVGVDPATASERPSMIAMWEDQGPRLSGDIQLILPDRHVAGFAEFKLSLAANLDDGEDLWNSHTSGRVHATFDWTTCDGPIAWDFDGEPHETGGSMSLRCEDGSLFAATIIKERYETEYELLFLALEDGSYVAG